MGTPTQTQWLYLVPNPKSAYRQLFVKGTRIRARSLYGAFMNDEAPRTPEEIAEDYDLAVEAVREAIEYCKSDPPEIRQDWEQEEALMEASGMNDPDYKYHGKPRSLSPQEINRILRS